jgi:uncharacterized metal-binding protein YceD (DUF177 family)
MTAPAVEFSRIVPLDRLASGVYRQAITAAPEERDALATRFGLLALDHLAATVELRRDQPGTVLLDAVLEASFVQRCVVSLEPVEGEVSTAFTLRYGPPEAAEPAVASAPDEPAFEPLCGDAIDIGEAVAQELSLQLPVFPRRPDAAVDDAAAADPPANPFAVLARRRGQTLG